MPFNGTAGAWTPPAASPAAPGLLFHPSRMDRLKITLTLMCLGLAACAPGPKQPATGPNGSSFDERFERKSVSASWTPSDITVTCGAASCPPQVGVVIFAKPKLDARGVIENFNLERCTGTLVAPDRVLTSAHCLVDGAEVHFILPSGPVRVSGVVYQAYSGKDAHAADVALLSLERPLASPPPLTVASGARPTYAGLTAYVSNRNGKNAFRIDRLDCNVRRDPNFLYDIVENPDLIVGFECVGQLGNSGSAMLGPNGQVEAVLQSINLTIKTVMAANVRCLPLTTSKPAVCVATDANTSTERAKRQSLSGWTATGKVNEADDQTFPYRFTRLRLRLNGPAETYELIRSPKCLKIGASEPTEIKYPSDLITVTTDASGNVTTNVADRRVTVARVTAKQGDRYRVEATWSEAFGPLEHEDKHPRVYLGKSFSIDLPRCAR